ncbi:hypothetical protein [Roseibium sp.]|uniref:hypothetical protein n=1 Tax=Roseibium sp. TaxID=1936156 RepID=UPI003D136F09
MTTVSLTDEIDLGNGKQRASVEVRRPRLIHVQKFVLAFGADTLAALMNRGNAQGGEDDTLAPETVKALLKAVITSERMDMFNEALALYLGISKSEVEQLSLPDLVKIGQEVAGFFTEIAGMVSELIGSED